MLQEGFGIMPNTVLFDKNLTDKQKLLFCLVSSLCAKEGFCWANNKYLAEKLGCKERAISNAMSLLQKSQYLTIEIDQANGNARKVVLGTSTIPPVSTHNTSCEKSHDLLGKNTGPLLGKITGPIVKNHIHNKIKNNTSIKKIKEDTSTIVEEASPVYGDPVVNDILAAIKLHNNGICDGTIKQQRNFAKHLEGALSKLDNVVSGKYTPLQVLNTILEIVSKNKYHSHKISSPEKIYRGLAELMNICRQEFEQAKAKETPSFSM